MPGRSSREQRPYLAEAAGSSGHTWHMGVTELLHAPLIPNFTVLTKICPFSDSNCSSHQAIIAACKVLDKMLQWRHDVWSSVGKGEILWQSWRCGLWTRIPVPVQQTHNVPTMVLFSARLEHQTLQYHVLSKGSKDDRFSVNEKSFKGNWLC